MAPWTPAARNGPQSATAAAAAAAAALPDQTELISRLHSDALDTPTTLPGRLAIPTTSGNARVHADSSSSDEDFATSKSSGKRSQHLRSMSNPFPSLFSGRKTLNPAPRPPVDFDMADDSTNMAKQSARMHKRGSPAGSQDYATGNCMTCASLVKWPKELKVFKCTICTTINDLVPVGSDGHGSGGSRRRHDTGHGASSSSKQSGPGPVQPISLDHTKRLVRQCLYSYISKTLRDLTKEVALEHKPVERPPHQDRLHPELAIRHRSQVEGVRDRRVANSSQPGYDPKYVFDEEPTLRPNSSHTNSPSPMPRSFSSSHSERPSLRVSMPKEPPNSHQRQPSIGQADDAKRIFKPLEDYIIDCFGSFECVNSSFSVHPPRYAARPTADAIRRKPVPPKDVRLPSQARNSPRDVPQADASTPVFDLDPKLLLLGDFAENGTWWTGGQDDMVAKRSPSNKDEHVSRPCVMTKSAPLNWSDMKEWYSVVNNAAESWFGVFEELSGDLHVENPTEEELRALEQDLLKGQVHTQRVLLKATENQLKRPGRRIADPSDLRFLLIILENPHLHSGTDFFHGLLQPDIHRPIPPKKKTSPYNLTPSSGLLSGQHSGIIKRIVGLMSNSSTECHNQLISWLTRYHATRFTKVKDLVSGFLTYRMIRQSEKKHQTKVVDVTAGLIPQMQAGRSSASLHDEIGTPRSTKKPKEPLKKISYADDWQIKAASRVLALLFAANNLAVTRRGDEAVTVSNASAIQDGVHAGGQLLAPSDFYNSMIDYADLVGDFESWESKRSKFSFCQYPFLLSIWAKTRILEYDARRQMQSKARDAFFDSIMTRRNINQYLVLDVRRDCLVDDSLTAVSGVIGSGGEDLKKGLRISFRGEEGIDAGGLRKEWFLLLVREVFNPDHGMFIYDEDSQYCYFNPNSFEASDQFFLVGVVMGLAIYNSTILDVALPPFAFRKLLASAPTPGVVSAHQRPVMKYTLEDLAEYRPRLAHGLKQLLSYDGDVEETFCLDFVVETDKYDAKVQAPLCPGGESKPVTNANRREYVDLYIRYILDTAVKRQFEPFKRGFYTVCGGNAFSLFRSEEIELLVRGSDEPLDIASLRAVAEYDNWESRQPDGSEPVVGWFWESLQQATPGDQRKMLSFITGSDRIPAMGAASLAIKISCLGDDCGRYPIARTCFNLLSLWRYESRERLEAMLWRAVRESEGFGLK